MPRIRQQNKPTTAMPQISDQAGIIQATHDREIILKITPPPTQETKPSTLDRITKIVQIIAICGGAIGTILLFVRFDNATRTLELQKKGQETRLAEIEVQAREGRKLDYDSRMFIEPPDDLSMLQPPQCAHDPQCLKQWALPEIRVKKGRPALNTVTFALGLTNSSALPVRVSSNQMSVHIGRRKIHSHQTGKINPPTATDGIIDWTAAHSETYKQGHGGNTGTLIQNQRSYQIYGFKVLAKHGDWIGIIANLTLDAPAVGDIPEGPSKIQYALDYCELGGSGYWRCDNNDELALPPGMQQQQQQQTQSQEWQPQHER